MERFETELAYPDSSFSYDDAHWTKILHDPAYRARLEAEAARQRAEAVRETVAVIGRAIGAVFRGVFRVFTMIAEASAAMRLYEELSRLDDAALADLGIRREQIGRYVADSMDAAAGRRQAVAAESGLAAIDGGRNERPAVADDLPRRRAA